MFTYCPNCATVFQVTAVQLSLAGGKVRCGECRHVYTATEYLFDDAAQARAALENETAPEEAPETEYVAAEAPVDYVRLPDVEEVPAEAVPPTVQPGLGGWEARSLTMGDTFSGLAIVGLVLLLGVQWVWFNRDALAAETAWRPALERFCATLHCTLPLRVDTEQLAIISRDVRQHPTADDALLINASFENRAEFAQPYPVFEVSFTDSDGEPVAIRRFLPAEYLADADQANTGLPVDTEVEVVLEVMDPGDQAVSFQFGFL